MEDEKHIKVGAMVSEKNKRKMQTIHDAAVEMGAKCDMQEEKKIDITSVKSLGGLAYAHQEGWDISYAASAISQIASMVHSEMEEPVHLAQLAGIIKELCTYISQETDEMIKAAKEGEAGEYEMMTTKIPAQVKSNDELNLSYVKSIGVELPINKLAVKYVGKNTIAHPVFIWGNKSKTDLEADFFTPESDFWDDALKEFTRPLTWEHGQDKLFAEIDENPVIGKTVKYYDDKVARWAESVITTDKQYRKYIDQFIEEKRLGYSSDSAPQYVQREKSGKSNWIKMWPWFGGSLTASPCEPRMKQLTPEYLKSLGIALPDSSVKNWDAEMLILDYLKIKHIK